MRYFIKQQVFSWRDRFAVKDAAGKDVYFIEGELFSWGKQLSVYDTAGNEVLYIKQNLWNWLPNYSLFMGKEEVAIVKKEFTFFRPSYSIQGPDWQVEGTVWAHDYQIWEEDQLIATINKEWFTWGDSYSLDIHEESHSLLALGVIIVIDCVMASEQSSNSSS